MKHLIALCVALFVVSFAADALARSQYRSGLMEQIDDESLKDVKAAIEKLGKSSAQCAYCPEKTKSKRKPFVDKVATFLLEKKFVTKDPVKPNEYVYDKTKWPKDPKTGKYPKASLDILKAAIQHAAKE
jgi:hypothetical protein